MADTTFDAAADVRSVRDRLRAEARQIRAGLPEPYRAHKSAEICKQLIESLTLTLGITGKAPAECTIAVYAAFPEEVDLADFISHAYELGCRVAFPCMMRDTHGVTDVPRQTMEMRAVAAEGYAAYAASSETDDPEPSQAPLFLAHPLKYYTHDHEDLIAFPYVGADELTMIVVPVVGFDVQGNRLGYGAGNYDRYLAQVPSSCRVVGVAFSEQQVEAVPTEAHDIPLAIVSL